MKRTIGLFFLAVFSLMLFPPTVQSLDYDWKKPKYSTDATNSAATKEGHPWGELEATPDDEYDNYYEVNFIIESVFSYIKYILFNAEYVPPTIIINHKNDKSDNIDINESNSTRQENEITNKRIPYSG